MFTLILSVAVGIMAVFVSESIRPVNLNLLEMPVRFAIGFGCCLIGNVLGRIKR